MRPIVAAVLLTLSLSACTIREDTFAPTGETQSDGIFFTPLGLNAPVNGGSAACPGGFARGSDLQTSRDGSQDLFCD